MNKIIAGLFSVVVLTITSTSVMSQHHRGHGFGHHVGPRFGHHHGHRHGHHHGHRRNYAPYIAGAIGAAIIGGIIYDQYGRRCYRQIIGYDYYDRPITRRVCD